MIEGRLHPHHAPTRAVTTYPKGRRCATCGSPCSIYTPPQPVTDVDLCNTHWRIPEGYCLSAAGQVTKEKT